MKTASPQPSFRQGAMAVAMLLSACSASPFTSQKPSPTASPAAIAPDVPSVVSSPTPTPPGELFQKGIDRAASAKTLAQSAQTPDDWSLVIGRWQEAIALMKAIPAGSPNHTEAQKLLAEYQTTLTKVQQQAKRGSSSTSPVATKPRTDDGISMIAGSSSQNLSDSNSSNAAAQNLSTLNQQQIEFFSKQNRFANSLEELKTTISASSPDYTYSTRSFQAGQSVSTAIAKRSGLLSYTSIVFMVKDKDNQNTPVSGICVTNSPSQTPPPVPQLVQGQVKCPAESTKV